MAHARFFGRPGAQQSADRRSRAPSGRSKRRTRGACARRLGAHATTRSLSNSARASTPSTSGNCRARMRPKPASARWRMRTGSSSERARQHVTSCAMRCWDPPCGSRASRPCSEWARIWTRVSSTTSPIRWSLRRVVNQTLARRYAIAIASLAREENAVERVGADLETISNAIGEYGLVHDFFVAPIIESRTKEKLLREAFEGRVHPIALHTLLLLVRKRREALLGAIVAEYLSARANGARRGAAHVAIGARARSRGEFALGLETRTVARKKVRGYRSRRSAAYRGAAHHDRRSPHRRDHFRPPQRARARSRPN